MVGVEPFEKDTLAYIQSINVTLDLMSVIKGNNYEIKKIKIIRPQLLIKILEDGTANYDIASASEESEGTEETDETESTFNLALKNFEISNAIIHYIDESMGIKLEIFNMNHTLSGNLTADATTLKTNNQHQ